MVEHWETQYVLMTFKGPSGRFQSPEGATVNSQG